MVGWEVCWEMPIHNDGVTPLCKKLDRFTTMKSLAFARGLGDSQSSERRNFIDDEKVDQITYF